MSNRYRYDIKKKVSLKSSSQGLILYRHKIKVDVFDVWKLAEWTIELGKRKEIGANNLMGSYLYGSSFVHIY